MADAPIDRDGRGDLHLTRSSAASFPFLWSGQPRRRAFYCDAGRSLDLDEKEWDQKWPLPFPYGRRGCHHPLCVLCGPRAVRSRSKRLAGRMVRAAASGVGHAGLTLTIEPFPLGQLPGQLDALSTGWARTRTNGPYAAIMEQHGIVGYLRAIHPRFSGGTWLAHFHVVVAASDEMHAQLAAVALGDRYKAVLLRAGFRVTARTAYVSEAADPTAIAVYYSDIWKASGDDGLRALVTAALHGDLAARAAYEEMVHALRGRSLTRGSGALGSRGAA